jgi:hypothetical protein
MTDTSELYVEYAKMYFNSDDIDLINNILHGNNLTNEMIDFYDKYLFEILSKVSLKENVKEVIDRLRLNNHQIILLTARGYKVKNGQIGVTRNYLKNHKIIVDKIIFKTRDKVNACIENKIDLMIDDSVKVLEDLDNNGINTLLFSTISNKKHQTDLVRVGNWLDLESYIDNYNSSI